MTQSKYTDGEVCALVAPIVNVNPEEVDAVVIIVVEKNGYLNIQGPDHTPSIISELIKQALIRWGDSEEDA